MQSVLHFTGAIQDWIKHVAKIPMDKTDEELDVSIIELGGTMGDIESAPFVEFCVGYANFALVHVLLVPDMHSEQKIKLTEMTVHLLRGLGLLPDLVHRVFYLSIYLCIDNDPTIDHM